MTRSLFYQVRKCLKDVHTHDHLSSHKGTSCVGDPESTTNASLEKDLRLKDCSIKDGRWLKVKDRDFERDKHLLTNCLVLSLQSRHQAFFTVNSMKFKDRESQFARLPRPDPTGSEPLPPSASHTEALKRRMGGQIPPKLLPWECMGKHLPLMFYSLFPMRQPDL